MFWAKTNVLVEKWIFEDVLVRGRPKTVWKPAEDRPHRSTPKFQSPTRASISHTVPRPTSDRQTVRHKSIHYKLNTISSYLPIHFVRTQWPPRCVMGVKYTCGSNAGRPCRLFRLVPTEEGHPLPRTSPAHCRRTPTTEQPSWWPTPVVPTHILPAKWICFYVFMGCTSGVLTGVVLSRRGSFKLLQAKLANCTESGM